MSKKMKSSFIALALGLCMMAAISVDAEEGKEHSERAVCGVMCGVKGCTAYTSNCISSVEKSCSSTGDETHRIVREQVFRCMNGHNTTVTSDEYESHSWDTNRWESIRHQPGSHTYRINCTKCGGSGTVTVICDYEHTGYHVTPF